MVGRLFDGGVTGGIGVAKIPKPVEGIGGVVDKVDIGLSFVKEGQVLFRTERSDGIGMDNDLCFGGSGAADFVADGQRVIGRGLRAYMDRGCGGSRAPNVAEVFVGSDSNAFTGADFSAGRLRGEYWRVDGRSGIDGHAVALGTSVVEGDRDGVCG